MVVDLIKQYIYWAENQTGLKVKTVSSDNGKEYICSNTKNYFKKKRHRSHSNIVLLAEV